MPPTRAIDVDPLHRLIGLAGPIQGPGLIAALLDDLNSTQSLLNQAWNGPDFAALRAQSHVLIALAGTIGDTDLHAMAQGLSMAAQTQDLGDLMDKKPNIMAGLSDLIRLLAHLHTSAGR